MRDELEQVRSWAKEKLATCEEPPWAFFQYMKLVEAVTAILDGMSATTDHSPQSGTHLRLVANQHRADSAPPRPEDSRSGRA